MNQIDNLEAAKGAITELFMGKRMGVGNKPTAIIETGSIYREQTTRTVLEVLYRVLTSQKIKRKVKKTLPIPSVIESHPNELIKARAYFRKWTAPIVNLYFGSAININEAILGMQMDPILLDPPSGIEIDGAPPIQYYSDYLKGVSLGENDRPIAIENLPKRKDGVYETLLRDAKHKKPLIIISGCGGTGWQEFNKALEIMGMRIWYIWAIGSNHIRSSRIISYIEAHNRQTGWNQILAHSKGDWIIAKMTKHPLRKNNV
jgi:hypothetical protein